MKPDKYRWDGDSRDERESEFTETNFSTTRSGPYHSSWAYERAKRRRKTRINRVMWIVLATAALSALVLYLVALRLRG